MDQIVVILGAGASRSVDGPLMNDFLDTAERVGESLNDLAESVAFKRVFGAIHDLSRAHSKAQLDTNNVEDVFAAFEMADLLGLDMGPNLAGDMRIVIARTVEQSVKLVLDGHDRYSAGADYTRFAEWLRTVKERTGFWPTVVTLNYDCALDFTLMSEGIPFSYMEEKPRSEALQLLKLHGSLNWVRLGDGEFRPAPIDHLQGLREFFRMSAKQGIAKLPVPFSSMARQLWTSEDGSVSEPGIVPPVWSKLDHYRQIRRVWKLAAGALGAAERILVCGYSLPATDQFFRHLYALGTIGPRRIRDFRVADPEETVGSRFRDMLGPTVHDRFTHQKGTFSEFVDWLHRIDYPTP